MSNTREEAMASAFAYWQDRLQGRGIVLIENGNILLSMTWQQAVQFATLNPGRSCRDRWGKEHLVRMWNDPPSPMMFSETGYPFAKDGEPYIVDPDRYANLGETPAPIPTACVVCGLPGSVVSLLRISWDMNQTDIHGVPNGLILANPAKTNDVLVCTHCVRGIKRIPFSEIIAREGGHVTEEPR